MENSCVVCGCYIPEGDHVCKFCRGTIVGDSTHAIKLETRPNIISIDTTVNTIEFRAETTAELMVQFAKYHVFQQNFTNLGTLSYLFIKQNMKPCDHGDMNNAQERLMEEYNRTVKLIESMIIIK